MFHNDWFAPSVLVDLAGRERELGACYGAAIAVTKPSLAAIGGFESPVMADAVAQDFVFGHELKRAGFKVALSPVPVATVVDEGSFEELLRHEQRWSRALRSVRPKEHALAVFMSPFIPSLVMLAASPLRALLPLVAVQLLLRQAVHLAARRAFPIMPRMQPWLVPIREAFSFLVWSGSFFGRKVRWGQVELKTGAGLRMDRTEAK